FAFVLGGLGQALLLIWADRVPHPVREGVFQFISGISTTGWQTSNIGQWDWVSIAFIVFTGMFIGGASGSTVGGIKVIRALLITKGIRWQISRAFLSRQTIQRVTFNGQSLRTEEMNEEFARAASFAILFLLMLIGCTMLSMLFLDERFTFAHALFESTSAQATVGLSAGITDPGMSPVVEVIYIFQMWAGRIEILPALVLFRAVFGGVKARRI
ncbi:MAG TPA: potassium transporter TrkG, partial [Bacteroidales bacterium]|nr:potassium transporter TrkG [Bacteroidales bacterium]